MSWKKLFDREIPRAKAAEIRAENLMPANYFSGPCIGGLRKTLDTIGVNVQKIEKL